MNARAQTRDTLDTIVSAFRELSDEHKLLLLDRLAEETNQSDEIKVGLREAALVYALNHEGAFPDADEAADAIIPNFRMPPAARKSHNDWREGQLRHAFTWPQINPFAGVGA